MKTIWKFNFTPDRDVIKIKMPNDAEVFHVGLDPSGTPAMWAKVSVHSGSEDRYFYVVGTGHPLPEDDHLYYGTFNHGQFVWHIYDAQQIHTN